MTRVHPSWTLPNKKILTFSLLSFYFVINFGLIFHFGFYLSSFISSIYSYIHDISLIPKSNFLNQICNFNYFESFISVQNGPGKNKNL